MAGTPHPIALLLFTRTPEEEAQAKQLLRGHSYGKQREAAAKLIEGSEQLLIKTGLPYFVLSSAEQQGNTFDQRLYHAFSTIFAQGYERVIAIGNDCPALKAKDILIAADTLFKHDIVAGPDTSGGIYLLGLTRQSFFRYSSFAPVRWNTAFVLEDLINFFQLNPDSINLIPSYADIDNHQDFIKALRLRSFRPALFRFFQSLLQLVTQNIVFYLLPANRISFIPVLNFRGPPLSRY